MHYRLVIYTEHSLQQQSSGSTAVAYVGIETENGTMFYGAGTDTDITRASVRALMSAYNNAIAK